MTAFRHIVSVVVASIVFFGWIPVALSAPVPEPPALAIVISIDQFRGDYLPRFQRHFCAGGFRLLLEHGANFVDCHHRHSLTKTGPGHAVMLTGVHADVNGIIGNDWLDNRTYERISCVGDPDVTILGLPPPSGPRGLGINDPYLGRSPRNLFVTTVGDELKLARGGRPKVIGIAEKDRAAILMSGKAADAAYFMENGRMVSSTYYLEKLPAWVEQWNAAGKIDAYFGQAWERLLPEDEYAVQGPDDAPGEDAEAGKLGRTLPKIINGGASAPGPAFLSAFGNSPFGNEVIVDFAQIAITEEKLGQRTNVTDLLCLGFSANDHIGHLYGPDSHEVMDMVLRTDRLLERFFAFLDQHVGLQRCVIVITADHGVSSTPEHIHALSPHIPAGRIDGAWALAAAEEAMIRAFGPLEKQQTWLLRDDAAFLIRPSWLQERGIEPTAAQQVVRDALLTVDFVQAAYTREELERAQMSDERGRQMQRSFNRERSGDVIYQARPFFFSRATGSNHGTPYPYDTHVPLLWYGAGVPAGVHAERVGVDDLAPTLANILGLTAPPQARGRILFAVP